eukprot:CAMPEP_0182883318 /NCGR_PEP_ID=MMETSP0034_2-20130328/18314_1 /TAXON_ID=156128 /ORGANISM="Nephroselmis pyriformis, Strain CCMP717" /LENGTH=67 /DNA_ID=CAMNT_0025016455 /DNA_START=39 /DNA_END=242 /DNA_ORIENTATION=-
MANVKVAIICLVSTSPGRTCAMLEQVVNSASQAEILFLSIMPPMPKSSESTPMRSKGRSSGLTFGGL